MLLRHGDVLIQQVASLPETVQPAEGHTLAYGEVTGHSHRFADPQHVELFKNADNLTFVKVLQPTTLIHEEHNPIQMPPGIYRYWIQREYEPKAVRQVID
jgi:hypothetical protein